MDNNQRNENRSEEELKRKNAAEPIPHRGEDENLEDTDPEQRNKIADAFKDEVGKSDENNEDSRIDTDAGSRHGMGNN